MNDDTRLPTLGDIEDARDRIRGKFESRTFPAVNGTFVHAFDDLDVMAGNGTIGLEILEDLPDVDAIVIPWGGGGLFCGIESVAAAVRLLAEHGRVVAEGAGACPLAGVLAGGAGTGKIVCLVSGGNIDLRTLAKIVGGRVSSD